jgi:molecular chaperone GrpE (heat shock protein)
VNYKKSVSTVLTAGLLVFGTTQAFAEKKPFTDVKEDIWYAESVQKLSDFNIIGGFEDHTFKPEQNVTRAQAASFLAKALKLDLSNVKNPGFKDVPTTNSHYAAIAALTEKGIFASGEYFNPGDSLTRAQMSKVLVKAFNLNSSNLKTFGDVKQTDWYYEYAGILGKLGVTTESNYNPKADISRAHLAAFIKRTIDNKRSDSIQDIWDTWQGWDNQEVPTEENNVPVDNDEEETNGQEEIDAAKIKEYERELDYATDDIKDAQKKLDNALEELDEAKDENDAEEIEEAEQDLLEVLSDLDDAISKGTATLETTRKVNLKELNVLQSVLENTIRKAKEELDKAYANTFDKELYEEDIEDALEALEDAREDAENAIEENSFELLQDSYKDLDKAIEEAEKTFEMYEESTVDVLEDEEIELEEAIEESKDLLDEVVELLEQKAEDQMDHFKDSLEDAEDALDDALDEEDNSEIYDAREALENAINNAQKALERIEDTELDSLADEIEELENAISKAEEELEESK